jgi:uncharacterized protein YecE (DUF72 family)
MEKRAPVRVGVAGWDYPDWKGVLYPKPKPRGFDPVRYLANYIDLIEINSTFYRPQTPEVAKRWVERIADIEHFRYTAKLSRRFTHERGSAWTRDEVKEVKAGMSVLNKAGVLDALLIQFPWSFKNEPKNREWLDDLTRTFEEYPLVVEVRHEGWNDPEFYAWLTERAIGFVNVDQPLFKKSLKPSARITSHAGYVRVHGRNYMEWFRKDAGRDARYDYLYATEELEPWVERTQEIAADKTTQNVDVVFNNHYKAQAVVNAVQFKALLTDEPATVPPLLYESYPDELAPHAFPQDPENLAA